MIKFNLGTNFIKYLNRALLLMFISIVSFGQDFSKDDKEILQLQDTRSLGKNNELVEFLNSDVTENTYRSALALANIGDSAVVNALGKKLLEKPESFLWHMSAFALGEIGTKRAAEYLSKALNKYSGVDEKLV